MNVEERFLRYVKIDTQSDESCSTSPSTVGQMEFAKALVEELKGIGLEDAAVDNNGYIMATLKSNSTKSIPTIGFIAHMDTAPDVSGRDVKPQIIGNYNGGDIELSSSVTLFADSYPEIKQFIGNDIIVTDGTTLLGSDDKAGIAEIITSIEYLIANPDIEHGDIKIAFTPDEEIGRGADLFDVKRFGAEWAYTVDSGLEGMIEFETFNAAMATVTVKGLNVHPGYAKGKMINSMRVAMEFANQLPCGEVPERTSDYEGFYHLISTKGSVEETTLIYIIRDHDRAIFESRKQTILDIADTLNAKYSNCISVDMHDQYYNMREMIEPVMHIFDTAVTAIKNCGIEPIITPVRGGTDGARLSYMGLPCPNLFTGGMNIHSRFEYISIQSMQKAVAVIVEIIKLVTKANNC